MARKATVGSCAVPAEIRALKPQGISCFVKKIRDSYYVYEHLRVPDPKRPGKLKNASGRCIGKIEGGEFVSNTQNNTAVRDLDWEAKDYGEYAAALACSSDVLDKLKKVFSVEDATRIYVLGIIYFVESYVPASYIKDVFDQSILSDKWPALPFSENSVDEFLKLLGRHSMTVEKFQQLLVYESSGYTALDGHVILSCSKENDLADYGNKYSKIGNKQLNLMVAYDVENNQPLTSKAFDGALPDKSAVSEWFEAYRFRPHTTFIVDMGFYSEDNLALYSANESYYVVPVPDNTVIAKMMKNSINFTGSFQYDKMDENGKPVSDTILYRESTVKELEELAQRAEDEKAANDYQERMQEYTADPNGKRMPRMHKAKQISHSRYQNDKLILLRNETMHQKMKDEYLSQIGQDSTHTQERYEELEPLFGVVVLRSNKDETAEKIYSTYKKRWKIETHYQHVRNGADFNGLNTEDYYSMQGLSFILLIEGLIYRRFMDRLKSAPSAYVSHMSVKECLRKLSHAKVSLHSDKRWYGNKVTAGTNQLLTEMGVTWAEDLRKLSSHTL